MPPTINPDLMDVDTRLAELREAHDAVTRELALLDEDIEQWRAMIDERRDLREVARLAWREATIAAGTGLNTNPDQDVVLLRPMTDRERQHLLDLRARADDAERAFKVADDELSRVLPELTTREKRSSDLRRAVRMLDDQISATEAERERIAQASTDKQRLFDRLRERMVGSV